MTGKLAAPDTQSLPDSDMGGKYLEVGGQQQAPPLPPHTPPYTQLGYQQVPTPGGYNPPGYGFPGMYSQSSYPGYHMGGYLSQCSSPALDGNILLLLL